MTEQQNQNQNQARKQFLHFLHYMQCGHGRCFRLLQSPQNRELFRDLVLDGCLHPFAFDPQCEGSRGGFMYRLTACYPDQDYFLRPVIREFLKPDCNDDWYFITHVCDLIGSSENPDCLRILELKYQELYQQIMSIRWSARANEILQCYEYLAIVVMQKQDYSRTLKICRDMGAYFLRRRRADPEELCWHFAWFLSCAKEQFGEDFLDRLDCLDRQLAQENSREIRRFVKIMLIEQESVRGAVRRTETPGFTAQDFQEKAITGEISRGDVIKFRNADRERTEHLRLAERFLETQDPEQKARLLQAFTISNCEFPLDPGILVDCTESGHEALRETAMDALLYVRSEKVRELAVRQLQQGDSRLALQMLIHNFQPDSEHADHDKKLILDSLRDLPVDPENHSGWHNIVMEIVKNIENLPHEFVLYIYEASLCSCCRESAVSELIRRDLVTEQILEECLQDCNPDIRELAENFKKY